MNWILHLETATKACSVALSADGKLIAVKEDLTHDYSHSENLTLFIEEVLKEAGISVKDLKAVSVASGPGSYTGLRIGVSTAKGLCYALNIPLVAVDALYSLAAIAADKYPDSNLCPLIDARRMEVFNALYDPQLVQLKPISADIIDDTTYHEFEPFMFFGDGAAKLQEIWKDRDCKIDIEIHSSATGQVKRAYEKFLAGEFEDVAYFEPFYLKDFMTK
jgi:tRNA threonylcarbamoyladenosine biosynthesis protein TsaB